MRSAGSTTSARPRRLARVWLLLLMTALPLALPAQEREGRFEVRSAELRLDNGVYYLDARLQYQMSSAALEALESGVPLTIELQLDLERERRFLPDEAVARLSQRYQLQYHALSDRFLVVNLNSGEQASFPTVFGALNALGRVSDLPVIDAELLDPDGRYRIALRAVLDTREFPGPLQLFVFWGDGWRIESDWYRWRLGN
jgi:hypothetical protein